MRGATSGAILATALLLAGSARAEDELDAAIAAFRERMEHSLDDTARVVAVHELGFRRDPRVVPVLKPLLQHSDLDIRVAAAQQIGEQKDPAVAPYLIALYEKEDSARSRSRPFLVALIEGIGEADARGRIKFLEKVHHRWHKVDLDLVRAVARAMAMARTPEAVEHLVDLLEWAQTKAEAPVQTEEERGIHEAMATQCRRLLRGVTGRDLRSARAWRDWWRENRRTWKAPAPGTPSAAGASADPMVWTDAAGEFSVRWPSKGWKIYDSEECLLTATRSSEGNRVAGFWVEADSIDGPGFKNAKSMAEAWRGKLDRNVLDQKPERCRWSVSLNFGGESAVLHEAFGRVREWGECSVRHVFVVNNGYMYHITGSVKGAWDDPIRKEFDDLFASFRFLKK